MTGPHRKAVCNGGSSAVPTKAETLDYIVDIAAELGELALKADYRKVAALLDAAVAEARLQNQKKDQGC
jgi:hypothetical protein